MEDCERARTRRNPADGKQELQGGRGRNVRSSEDDAFASQDQLIGTTISSLPCGVLAHIFEGLGPRDLASASCVCKAWRHLVALEAAANLVWRSFYSARWQLSGAVWPKTLLPPATPAPMPKHQPHHPQPHQHQPQHRTLGVGSGGAPGSGARSAPRDCPSVASSSCSSSPACSLSSSPEMRWQWAYGSKMLRLRSWSGRYSADQVVGHKAAVRAVRLLPSMNLLATASLDRTVRLWDLAAGLPIAASRPHGGTVRCLALDPALLASGCSDNLVRVWHPRPPASSACGPDSAVPLYDISSKPYLLRGHTGPVSCLALDEAPGAAGARASTTIFSGSWDCTVRMWRQRHVSGGGYGSGDDDGGSDDGLSDAYGSDADQYGRTGRCHRGGGDSSETIFGGASGDGGTTSDEGSSGGGGTAAASGAEAAAAAAGLAARRRARRAGAGGLRRGGTSGEEDGGWSCTGVLQYGDWVYCCAVRGGNLLVAAGSEVVVTDAATGRAVRRFADLHDGGSVACLEGCRSGRLLFTAGSGDGLLLAHDLRMKQGSRVLWHHNAAVTGLAFEDPWLASSAADGCIILQDSEQALAGGGGPQRALNSSCRALHCPAGQPALCLDLADQWLTAGTDSGVVRLWDFTGAAAAAERAAASRAARSASKSARAAARHQQQQQQFQAQHAQLQTPAQMPQAQAHQKQHSHRLIGHQLQQQGPAPSGSSRQLATSPASGEPGTAVNQGLGTPATPAAPGSRTEGAEVSGTGTGQSAPCPVSLTGSNHTASSQKLRGGGNGGGGGGGGGAGSAPRRRHGHRASQPATHSACQLGPFLQPQAPLGTYLAPNAAHQYHHLHHLHHLQQQQQQPQQSGRVRAPWPKAPPVQVHAPFRYVMATGASAAPGVAGGAGGSGSGGGGNGGGGGSSAGASAALAAGFGGRK